MRKRRTRHGEEDQHSPNALEPATVTGDLGKIVSAEEAVRVIQNGDTVANGVFVGIGVPEEILLKIEEYFVETGRPRNLTLVYAAGQGAGKDRGPVDQAHINGGAPHSRLR